IPEWKSGDPIRSALVVSGFRIRSYMLPIIELQDHDADILLSNHGLFFAVHAEQAIQPYSIQEDASGISVPRDAIIMPGNNAIPRAICFGSQQANKILRHS